MGFDDLVSGNDDVMSALERLLGDDESDAIDSLLGGDVGAVTRATTSTKMPTKALALAKIGQAAVKSVVEQRQGVTREKRQQRSIVGRQPSLLLGIDSTASLGALIGAGATNTINCLAQDHMVITRFEPRPANAGDFAIHDIKVRRTSIMSGTQAVPADAFLSSDPPPLETEEIWPGTPIQVVVENLALAPRRFLGQFRGIDLDKK